MAQILKSGYLRKFSKGTLIDDWKKVFVEFDSSGYFHWYKKKNSASEKRINLHVVKEYLASGIHCKNIPRVPRPPLDGKQECMFAFPKEITKNSKIHFFLCDNEDILKEWMTAITNTFQSLHSSQSQANNMTIPTAPNYNLYPQAPPQYFAQAPPPYGAPPLIGFEALSISNRPLTPQPTLPQAYQQQNYYPHASTPQSSYAPYAQQQPQIQPMHGYTSQPYASGYNRPVYPQFYPTPYGGSAPNIAKCPAQQQTIIIQDRHSSTSGLNNLAAGFLGGALLGYAAPPIYYGGYGCGLGWGRGSWGSWSCSSGSWGSF